MQLSPSIITLLKKQIHISELKNVKKTSFNLKGDSKVKGYNHKVTVCLRYSYSCCLQVCNSFAGSMHM